MNQTVRELFSDPGLLKEIESSCRHRAMREAETILRQGDEIVFVPIVLSGSIRVLRQDEKGQEVFLYHLFPGQTCAMSLTCCLSGKKSMIKAVAETKGELLLIPVKQTEEWHKYDEWRSYISGNYNSRFEELLEVIDLIAFSNMDRQLLRYLEDRARAINSRSLVITHQQVADELHAHREAVSRLLRTMEKKGLVKLSRNNIEVLTI